MRKIQDLIRFVKSQAIRVRTIIDKHPDDARSKGSLVPVLRQFEEVALELQRIPELEAEIERLSTLNGQRSNGRKTSLDNLEVHPKDLEGLPDELIAQLSISESDREEFELLALIEAAGGTMSLDQILIGLYKKRGEIYERVKLNQRLYRMATKGALYSVPGRKGWYSIYEPSGSNQQDEKEKEQSPQG